MSKKIIKAMNGYVVEMTEKRAKKARKMIEGKGMKVEENHFSIGNGQMKFMFYYREKWIIDYKTNEKLMPWKQFKSMFQKKKKRGIEIITFGIDFGLIGSDISVENIIKHEKTDTPKPDKEQEIDWSKIQVVESENFKVITSGHPKETTFSGLIIHTNSNSPSLNGQYRSDLVKEHFKLCKDQTIKFD